MLTEVGFSQVHFAADNLPEFGVDHSGTWSLPIAARKGHFRAPAAELAREYREACRLAKRKIRDLDAITAEYERHIAFHNMSQAELERDLDARIEYLHKVEADFEERTAWALELDSERKRTIAEFDRIAKSEADAWVQVETLQQQLKAIRAELAGLQARRWTKLGRKLGAIE
jgi:chromosome segregation ATPase